MLHIDGIFPIMSQIDLIHDREVLSHAGTWFGIGTAALAWQIQLAVESPLPGFFSALMSLSNFLLALLFAYEAWLARKDWKRTDAELMAMHGRLRITLPGDHPAFRQTWQQLGERWTEDVLTTGICCIAAALGLVGSGALAIGPDSAAIALVSGLSNAIIGCGTLNLPLSWRLWVSHRLVSSWQRAEILGGRNDFF